MDLSTKEKSNQKRKRFDNQNNTASYFRLGNTGLHHYHYDNHQFT